MKFRDPLPDWTEPESIRSWGDKVSPRPALPWLDYINYYVHPDVVTAVGRLLVPAFVEHEGGVFLRDRFSLAGYSRWQAELGELVAVEKMINHPQVYDLFASNEDIAESAFEGVANVMAQTLRMALNKGLTRPQAGHPTPSRHFGLDA